MLTGPWRVMYGKDRATNIITNEREKDEPAAQLKGS
jgi:hypothetical protein